MHNYFEGWYFKQQNGHDIVAFIPALHIDNKHSCSVSLQIITNDSSYCIEYPYESFSLDKHSLSIKVGNCSFTKSRIDLDIQTDEIKATGTLRFGVLFPISYDIMGPFKFVPFMECRHSVFSMYHRVNGSLVINGKTFDFTDGTGYLEGDRGFSFPTRYAWTQCSWKEKTPCSLMLSVADIPFMGNKFTGIICIIVCEGKEYRLATYLGAKVTFVGEGHIIVKQGKYTLTAELLEKREFTLRAPVRGRMIRLIRENPSCRARYHFARNDEVLLDFTTDSASFEYEYD